MKQVEMFILAALAIVFGYDFYLYFGGGTEATISWYLYTLAYEKPFVPFLIGFLCGHLFWSMHNPRDWKKIKPDKKL
jgi:hypothetical protein